MKKLMAILLVGVMVFSLVACGSSDFAGEWKATSLDSGQDMSAQEKSMIEGMLAEMTISAKDDGTATMTAMGQTKDIKWEADGNTITLTAEGDPITGELDGDKFVLDMNGVKIVFER